MILPNHFIFYQPSNIVSGDFYFIRQVRQHTIVCAIDCTGHGVPGAFLSMLGTALLNEIVLTKEVTKANEVLDELREKMKMSLQQTGRDGERQEGMDIAFCSINLETMEMSFAGAHNPLWLFRKINERPGDNVHPQYELIEFNGDRQSVGIGYKEKPFEAHNISLKTGDIFYLFTDGYYSQFSYISGITFKSNRFKELLSKIHQLPMHQQKSIIEQRFNSWKGNTPQTDDVLVIGVRV
jgi:serine phosphatase RsbU (regulator of sigma subunit)